MATTRVNALPFALTGNRAKSVCNMCDCNEPVPEDSYVDRFTNHVARGFLGYCRDNNCSQTEALRRLTKGESTVVAARVPNGSAAKLRELAEARGLTVGALARRALLALTAAPDPKAAFEAIRKALGLPADASAAEVGEAASALVAAMAELESPDDDEPAESDQEPTGEAPDADPPAARSAHRSKGAKDFQTSRGVVTLSASELDACARHKAKPEEYAENKAARLAARGASPRPAVRRTSVELTAAGQRLADEMTPEHRANFEAALETMTEARAREKRIRASEKSRGIAGIK